MTDKVQKIKEWISKTQDGLMNTQGNFEYPEHEGAYNILCNLDAYIDSLQEEPVSVWHDASEMPKEKKVCLIRYSANDGASTNNFEVVIAEPFTRRFVTRSYPHKTGYQHTIHGENTIKVDEYQDRREYIPFSDIDEWAYIDDLLNLSNVQRAVKNWKEPVSEELISVAKQYIDSHVFGNEEDKFTRSVLVDMFCSGAKWQKTNLWKPADGEDLPEIDREVIALLDNGKVVFAHRPPEYWDGKNIITGKVTRNYPKTYDKGGWNIPDVKFWLDVEPPKEIEL